MLGQPISMLMPKVVGFKLSGELPEGSTATDLVLTVTELLRGHGVVGKFVEFYGPGVGNVPVENRATIGNMSPEYGSTCAIFPIDAETLRYLSFTGRPPELVALVEAYAKEQGLWHDPEAEPRYSETVELDLGTVVPSLAGPRRPQDRVALTDARRGFRAALADMAPEPAGPADRTGRTRPRPSRSRPATRRRPWPGRPQHEQPRPRAGRLVRARPDRGQRPAQQPGAGHPGGRHPLRPRPRARGHRRHHQLHQHLQPVGDAGRRAAGPQRRRPRPGLQAVGQDLAGPRLQGGHGLLRAGRAAAVPREARLPPGRVRLHHLHRQLRAAGPRDLPGGHRRRPGGGLGAERQPQLRGPHQPRLPHELPGLAAAGGRLRPGRDDGHRPARRPARPRPRRQPRLPARPLAVQRRGGRADRPGRPVGHVPQELRPGVRGRRALEHPGGADRGELRLGRRLDLRAPPALLRRHARHPRAGHRHPRRPGPGRARRQRHHRPHLARRGHQARQPGRPLPGRAGRRGHRTSTPTGHGGATTR